MYKPEVTIICVKAALSAEGHIFVYIYIHTYTYTDMCMYIYIYPAIVQIYIYICIYIYCKPRKDRTVINNHHHHHIKQQPTIGWEFKGGSSMAQAMDCRSPGSGNAEKAIREKDRNTFWNVRIFDTSLCLYIYLYVYIHIYIYIYV